MADKVVTGEVRLSYATLDTPRQNEQGHDQWSVLLLIPKSDRATLAKLKRSAEQALEEGIASSKLKKGTGLKNAWGTLKDGDERDDVDEHTEYAGMMYMNVNARRKPGVVDRFGEQLAPSEAYSGSWARVSLDCYAYNSNKNSGITFGLRHVQKRRDDERLDGLGSAEDDFDFDDAEEGSDLI